MNQNISVFDKKFFRLTMSSSMLVMFISCLVVSAKKSDSECRIFEYVFFFNELQKFQDDLRDFLKVELVFYLSVLIRTLQNAEELTLVL